jgi:transketolase
MKWLPRKDKSAPPEEMRKIFAAALQSIMDSNPDVIALDADLAGASGWNAIAKSHPRQFVDVGIAEANMIGIAAGLSTLGFVPFVHSFSPFASRRVADQVYLEGSFARNTINIYASDPGICSATNGGTHTTFEDVAFMSAVPGVRIFHPADAVQLGWLVKTVAGERGVHYIRASRKTVPDIYEPGSTFEIGRGNLLREGRDLLIISAGELLGEALAAAEEMESLGVSSSVADMFTIKPLDAELIISRSRGKKLVITLENHSVHGGLGSAVASVMAAEGEGIPLRIVGVEDRHGQVGSFEFLKREYGLTSERVVSLAKEVMKV